jgi:NAD(P)H-flavin reductase
MSLNGNQQLHKIQTPAGGYHAAAINIVRREDFSDVTFLLEINHPMMANAAQPGQFVPW